MVRPERAGGRRSSASTPFGVYVHVPFCSTRCDYCAFATWTDRPHLDRRLPRRRCATEIERAVAAGMAAGDERVRRRRHADAGAGRRAWPRCCGRSRWRRGAEVTVECNPDDVTEALFETYVAAGVNRVSIGVQSMVPHVLAALGRTHDPANVERAVAAVRAVGLPTFNLDIIYGAAGESLADWRTTLERGARRSSRRTCRRTRSPSRPGTPLADDPARHPDDDVQADEYELADDLLTARRAGQLRGVELGPARPRVPPQPPLLAPARLPRLRLRGPLAPRRAALVEPAHAGALHRRRRAPAARPRRPARRSTPTPGASRACSCRCARRPACRVDALDGDDLPGVVERAGDRWVLTRRGRLMANEVAVRLR